MLLRLDSAPRDPSLSPSLQQFKASGACVRLPSPVLYELLELLQNGRKLTWPLWAERRHHVLGLLHPEWPIAIEREHNIQNEVAANPELEGEILADYRFFGCVMRALTSADTPEAFDMAIASDWGFDLSLGSPFSEFAKLKASRLRRLDELGYAVQQAGLREGKTNEELVAELLPQLAQPSLRPIVARAMRAKGLDRNTPIDALVASFAENVETIVISYDEKLAKESGGRDVFDARGGVPSTLAELEAAVATQARGRRPHDWT